MGVFLHPITVFAADDERSHIVEALVDTGSNYTWMPDLMLESLGVVSDRERRFIMADERRVQMRLGEVRVELLGDRGTTRVVFAAPGSQPIIGAVTLEEFGLAMDPVNQRLVPADLYPPSPRLVEDRS